MNKKEKDYIVKNLPDLIELTKCNVVMLAELRAEGILSCSDCETLQRRYENGGSKEQAYELYNILVTRTGSYDVLHIALSKHNQSGAAEVLQRGKESGFSQHTGTAQKFLTPHPLVRSFVSNVEAAVLVLCTEDILLTTHRIQAEQMSYQFHLFTSKKALDTVLSNDHSGTVLLIAIYGRDTTALETLFVAIHEKGTTVKMCIVVTTEDHTTVQGIVDKICMPSHFCKVVQDDIKWGQLRSEWQEELLNKLVKFQGREMQLNDLLASYSNEEKKRLLETCLETKFLAALDKNEKPVFCKNTVGAARVNALPVYIHRKVVSRSVNVSKEILEAKNSDKETLFVITGMSFGDLYGLKAGNVCRSGDALKSKKPLEAKFILLEKRDEMKDLCAKASSERKNLHWLHFNKEKNNLEWVKSFGTKPDSLSLVQRYVARPTPDELGRYHVTEQQFITELIQEGDALLKKRGAICISDNPGMGKTILLVHIGEELLKAQVLSPEPPPPVPKFVQFFVMTDLMRDLEEKGISSESELTTGIIIETLLNRITDTKIVWDLFQRKGTKCELLLDGMDEVLPHQTQLAFKFIFLLRHEFEASPTFRIWVTTRPVLLARVEQTLGVLGYSMLPFDEKDQMEFLKEHWSRGAEKRKLILDSDKLESFTRGCLKTMKSVNAKLSDFEMEMTGVPLQCLLLAEICQDFVNSNCLVSNEEQVPSQEDPSGLVIKNIADLYRRVMDKKLEIFLNRESSGSHLESHVSKNNRQVMKRAHMKLALELLFPEWLDKFEIIFLHEAFISPEELTIYGFATTSHVDTSKSVFVHRTFAEYFVSLFVVEIGTCERLTGGFRVTEHMANFFLNGALPVQAEDAALQQLSHGLKLASFKMPVVAYFINSLLDMEMTQITTPASLHQSIHNNLEEISAAPFEIHESKILACITNDRAHLAKLLIDSLDNGDGKGKWLSKSKEHHATMVYAAAMRGDKECLEMLCNLLECGENVTISKLKYNVANRNPLLIAATRGKVESVMYLLDDKGFVPQMWALPDQAILHQCVQNSVELDDKSIQDVEDIIEILVRSQGEISQDKPDILEHLDFRGRTPLLAEKVHVRLRMALIRAGADVKAYDENGYQVLHMLGCFTSVTPENYHALVEQIVEALEDGEECTLILNKTSGASTSEWGLADWLWYNDTPLHFALGFLEVQEETLDLFKEYNFDWNAVNSYDMTLVHIAVKYGRSLELIKKLIEQFGVDWNTPSIEGKTAFHEAASSGHLDFLEWVCSNADSFTDVDIDSGDYNQRSALHYGMGAAVEESKRFAMVKILLEIGQADANALDYGGDTPLVYSLYESRGTSVEFLKYLKEKDALILGNEEDDKTSVLKALFSKADESLCKECNLAAVVEYLVGEGVVLNGLENQPTLVHLAAKNGWLNGLKLLKERLGEDEFNRLISASDGTPLECTALYSAIEGKCVEVIKWMSKTVGERVLHESCATGGMKPLHVCAKVGWLEGIQLLLNKYGVDAMIRDDEGNTVFHMAHCAEAFKFQILEYLQEHINRGEDMDDVDDVRNNLGETPEQYGKRNIQRADYLDW